MAVGIKEKYNRALVTGGAGFIGSHIVEQLLEEGLDVISADNYAGGKKENLAPLHERFGGRLEELEVDVTDYGALRACYEGVDIVFHEAASKKTVCLKDPRRDMLVNGTGTFNVLELARDFGVKKIVHASSGSVYGEPRYFPQDEEHPLNPTSYYGVSKLAGEKYARAFCDLYGMDCTILRYFHVYGPRQENSDVGGVVSIFGRRVFNGQPPVIFGDGTQQRSFTYVKDLARINLLAAMAGGTRGEAYNCASGINFTIGELAEKVKEHFGRGNLANQYADWTVGDIRAFDVSNEKLRKLGFEFRWSFDEGLSSTLNWLAEYLKGK
ncbi:MAG: SDR family NAD(P)-dependent oxidoreductase [Oscillospiraceae bacterium]|jgi:UDP-glucose 4-epimerase|nr:SDR family NAD(P)-dependent oxidoreductase [Oscillospiraceae bacterium]